MKAVLEKIAPLHPDKVPPQGSVMAGTTPWGDQLYRLRRARSKSVPAYDEDGKRMYRRSLTGDKLYPMNRPELYEEELLFYLHSEGNGNVVMVPWSPPTQEQIDQKKRKETIKEMQEKLAEKLVDSGMSPDEAVARLVGGVPMTEYVVDDEPAVEETVAEVVVEKPKKKKAKKAPPVDESGRVVFPYMYGPGMWKLSDESTFRGKKADAIEAEKALKVDLPSY